MIHQTGLVTPQVDALIEHLWRWLTVTTEDFDTWYGFASPALDVAMGDPLTTELQAECRRAHVEPVDLREILGHTAEIVYRNLFALADNAQTLADLREVERIASRYGVTLAPAVLFAGSAWSVRGGWGPRMSTADVARWRSLNW